MHMWALPAELALSSNRCVRPIVECFRWAAAPARRSGVSYSPLRICNDSVMVVGYALQKMRRVSARPGGASMHHENHHANRSSLLPASRRLTYIRLLIKLRALLLLAVVCAGGVARGADNGDLDPTFGGDGIVTTDMGGE